MKPLTAFLFVFCIALRAAAAQQGETIAVLELRSRVHPVAAAELNDRLREAVRRAAPDARVVDREGEADFVISGRVSRGGMGYRAIIELQDRGGDLIQRASATASTRRELGEAIEGAAADLLRSRSESLAGGPKTIPRTRRRRGAGWPSWAGRIRSARSPPPGRSNGTRSPRPSTRPTPSASAAD